MIKVTCAECFGTGDGPFFSPDTPEWIRCESCDGSGANFIPDTALLRLGMDAVGPLITTAYVHERLHMAEIFMEGWDAACNTMMMGPEPIRYTDVRDYLLGYETDPIVAALIALWLTRDEWTIGRETYWDTFHPSFYEAEIPNWGRPRLSCPDCGTNWYVKSGESGFNCPLCGGLVMRREFR
jgi:hypothetical protein